MSSSSSKRFNKQHSIFNEQVKHLYKICDPDDRGWIEKPDLYKLSVPLNLNNQLDSLNSVFDMLDVDGNGRLTFEEFCNGFGEYLGLNSPKQQTESQKSSSSSQDSFSENEEFNEFLQDFQMDKTDTERILLIFSIWQQIRENSPHLMSNFEQMLAQLIKESRERRERLNNLRSVQLAKTSSMDETLANVTEETERERCNYFKSHQRQRSVEFDEEIKRNNEVDHEKLSQLEALTLQIEQVELEFDQFTMFQAQSVATRDEIVQSLSKLRLQVSTVRRQLDDSEMYLDELKRREKQQKRERAKQTIGMNQSIVLERVEAANELALLEKSNEDLKRQKDEYFRLKAIEKANKRNRQSIKRSKNENEYSHDITLLNPQTTITDKNSINDKDSKITKINRRGSVLSDYFDSKRKFKSIDASFRKRRALNKKLDETTVHENEGQKTENSANISFTRDNVSQNGENIVALISSNENVNLSMNIIEQQISNEKSQIEPNLCVQHGVAKNGQSEIQDMNNDLNKDKENAEKRIHEKNDINNDIDSVNKAHHENADVLSILSEFESSCVDPEIQKGISNNKRHIFKVVLLGDSSVGKTSLLQQLCYRKFAVNQFAATLGVDFCIRKFALKNKNENEAIKFHVIMQLWDTAGQERYRGTITGQYLRKVDAAVLVYDVTRPVTLVHCASWLEDLRLQLPPLANSTPASPFKFCPLLLLGNKIDMLPTTQTSAEHNFNLSQATVDDQGKSMRNEKHDEVDEETDDSQTLKSQLSESDISTKLRCFKVSAKTGKNVHKAFRCLARMLKNLQDDYMKDPSRYEPTESVNLSGSNSAISSCCRGEKRV